MIKGDVLLFALLQQLFRATHIPKCADRIRGTTRYDVRRPAPTSDFTRHVIHHRIKIRALGVVAQVCTEYPVE